MLNIGSAVEYDCREMNGVWVPVSQRKRKVIEMDISGGLEDAVRRLAEDAGLIDKHGPIIDVEAKVVRP